MCACMCVGTCVGVFVWVCLCGWVHFVICHHLLILCRLSACSIAVMCDEVVVSFQNTGILWLMSTKFNNIPLF